MLSTVLIIDKRRELSVKYKKSVENEETSALITHNLKEAFKIIPSLEPDMIIISDSIDENLADFCEKIRTLTYNMRPIIVALSKSAEAEDRIAVLESGADDFLSEPVNIDEFKTRIRAHLRRDIELNLDNKTLLPNKKIVTKSLKRVLNSEEKSAVLLIGFENLENYRSVYSDVAGDKLLQTFVAITKSALEKDDFLGQLDESTFVIITNMYSAEKLSAFLTFAFDTVAPKFYSESDAKRGYTLMKSDRQAGMRANFVSINIGGIVDNFGMFSTVNSLLEKLYSTKKLAKTPSGSNYLIDRLRLTGESEESLGLNKTVYIRESDEALSLLLRTTLELQGYDVAEDLDISDSSQPKILIIDSADDMSGLEICRKLKSEMNFVGSKIIVTSTLHDKSAVLNSGADLYLPKPYEITELIKWVEYFSNQD